MKRLIILIVCLGITWAAAADYLITSRSANLKEEPTSNGPVIESLAIGTTLTLLDQGIQQAGYYHVATTEGAEGWVYRTLVRRYPGIPEPGIGSVAPGMSNTNGAVVTLDFHFNLPKPRMGEQLITHEGFTSCMSEKYMLPVWVSHQISDELLHGDAKREGSTYPKDEQFAQLKANAYAKSGYDHGHLAPAADFKRSQELTDESFYMTNMAPQHGCMNQKGWCVLESNVRNWARLNPTSTFYLFSGPITSSFIDTLCINNATTVYVPEQFYKIVIEQTASGLVQTAAFMVRNDDTEFADLDGGRTTIDVIESMTGLDFMPALSRSQQRALESKSFNYQLVNLPECGGSKSCTTVYGRRTTPEGRTAALCR